jgi:hypothetical protein
VNQRDAGVVLNGITVKELQDMVTVRPGPNGNVYVFPEIADRHRWPRNPQFLAPPTTPGEFGQFIYLYGPGCGTWTWASPSSLTLPPRRN